jgi:hypothetical protein
LRPSRRQVMGASLIGGIAVYLAPLGSRAFASLFEEQLLTRPAWNDSVLKYRIDGTSKVMGAKVFARDIRARDMPHWPQQQSHALMTWVRFPSPRSNKIKSFSTSIFPEVILGRPWEDESDGPRGEAGPNPNNASAAYRTGVAWYSKRPRASDPDRPHARSSAAAAAAPSLTSDARSNCSRAVATAAPRRSCSRTASPSRKWSSWCAPRCDRQGRAPGRRRAYR